MRSLLLCFPMLALCIQLASSNTASCECPSCHQRNQAERCRCCVYRQLGKRSGEDVNADFPLADDQLDHGGPESRPPILSLFDTDDLATKMTEYLSANDQIKQTQNLVQSVKPWLSLDWTNLDNDLSRLLQLNYVLQVLRNKNEVSR